ncbi:MFS general substrate transporter [Crepidotus variabilis]|uniref:MFS general substrate transporter n=1 Tax=Crepidotus variabilis TaxID=179855 RepID=A0A9P6JJD3_9AGAR|nr:MFS general substrate transporter [Crepidotus variabilis]
MAELTKDGQTTITRPQKCVLVDEKPLPIHCDDQLHEPTLPPPYDFSQQQIPLSDDGFIHQENGWKGRQTVLGAFIGLFCSFGQLNAFGTFQAWYATHQLSHLTPSTISWIGSLQLWMFFFSGCAIGRLFDRYGPKWIMTIGAVCFFVGMMLTSICVEYYQYILAQGIILSLGVGFLFYPAISSVSTHFSRYRSTAIGIAIAGSSLGGVAYPIVLQHLFQHVGFGWGVRIAAIVTGSGCVIATLLTNRYPSPLQKGSINCFQLRSFCDAKFLLLAAGSGVVALGLFNPLFYVVSFSRTLHDLKDLSPYVLAVMNAGGVLGRILPAYLSDRIGRFNLLIPAAFCSGLSCLVLWLNANTGVRVVVFAGLYGFFSGAFISVLTPCVAQISEFSEIGIRIGMIYSTTSFPSLLGGPIAGALLSTHHGSYAAMAIFSGCASIIGSFILLASKLAIDRRLLARV